jgi:uncharacterized tellurite resistance protein B-like protein
MNSEPSGIAFSPKMALCLAAITLVGIDGEFKEEELNKLRELIKNDETAFLKAFNFYNEHTVDICIKTITARLNEEQKKYLYQVLYDLSRSDRDIAAPEIKLMEKYALAFGLDDKLIESIRTSPRSAVDLSVFE